jgi:hypothetical protein
LNPLPFPQDLVEPAVEEPHAVLQPKELFHVQVVEPGGEHEPEESLTFAFRSLRSVGGDSAEV